MMNLCGKKFNHLTMCSTNRFLMINISLVTGYIASKRGFLCNLAMVSQLLEAMGVKSIGTLFCSIIQ